MKRFTRDKLGALFLDAAAPVEIKELYKLSTARKPIMLVLGADAGEPLRRLLKLAEKKVGQFLGLATVHTNVEDSLILMSPSSISVPKIRAAMTSGRWVLIQNCHICSKQTLNLLEALFDEVRKTCSHNVKHRPRFFSDRNCSYCTRHVSIVADDLRKRNRVSCFAAAEKP